MKKDQNPLWIIANYVIEDYLDREETLLKKLKKSDLLISLTRTDSEFAGFINENLRQTLPATISENIINEYIKNLEAILKHHIEKVLFTQKSGEKIIKTSFLKYKKKTYTITEAISLLKELLTNIQNQARKYEDGVNLLKKELTPFKTIDRRILFFTENYYLVSELLDIKNETIDDIVNNIIINLLFLGKKYKGKAGIFLQSTLLKDFYLNYFYLFILNIIGRLNMKALQNLLEIFEKKYAKPIPKTEKGVILNEAYKALHIFPEEFKRTDLNPSRFHFLLFLLSKKEALNQIKLSEKQIKDIINLTEQDMLQHK